jgi:hypothetical protein
MYPVASVFAALLVTFATTALAFSANLGGRDERANDQ